MLVHNNLYRAGVLYFKKLKSKLHNHLQSNKISPPCHKLDGNSRTSSGHVFLKYNTAGFPLFLS